MEVTYKKVRKPAKCVACNRTLQDGDTVFTIPCAVKNANGGVAYVCSKHGTPEKRRYNDVAGISGNVKKDGLLYNVRLTVTAKPGGYPVAIDGVTVDSKENALAYIANVWNGAFVVDGQIVLEMPDNTTLSGWRDNLARTLSVLGVRFAPFMVKSVYGLDTDSTMILEYVTDILEGADNATIADIFGKGFRKSAKMGTDFSDPKNWAVIGDNTVQFNIAYTGTISQYMRCVDFLAGLVKIAQSSKKNKFAAVDTLWRKTTAHGNAVDHRSTYGDRLNRARVEK